MILVFTGAVTFENAPIELRVERGRFTGVGAHVDRTDARIVALDGKRVVPAFLDAHVHLALYPREAELLDAGVAGVIDWGAPLAAIGRPDQGLVRQDAGPLLTAPGGYPTRGWGRDGYGLEVTDAADAVRQVLDQDAAFVKIAMAGTPGLTDAQIRSLVRQAHAAGRKVGAHALSSAEAARARRLGVDILVHTPVEPLDDATVRAWKGGTVISTLTAFGAGPHALANLRALREAGATVVYGTDLGNSRDASIQCGELSSLHESGMTPAQVLRAGTAAPAALMGLEHGLVVGRPASFLVLGESTLPALCRPQQVWIRGVPRR